MLVDHLEIAGVHFLGLVRLNPGNGKFFTNKIFPMFSTLMNTSQLNNLADGPPSAPSSARVFDIAQPIPRFDATPVTTATFPFNAKSMINLSLEKYEKNITRKYFILTNKNV